VADAAAIGRFGVIRAEIWRRLRGCRVAGAGFRCRALADCSVCAAARVLSFSEVSVFVAAVGGVAAVFFSFLFWRRLGFVSGCFQRPDSGLVNSRLHSIKRLMESE
jgi:hypothetical protein